MIDPKSQKNIQLLAEAAADAYCELRDQGVIVTHNLNVFMTPEGLAVTFTKVIEKFVSRMGNDT